MLDVFLEFPIGLPRFLIVPPDFLGHQPVDEWFIIPRVVYDRIGIGESLFVKLVISLISMSDSSHRVCVEREILVTLAEDGGLVPYTICSTLSLRYLHVKILSFAFGSRAYIRVLYDVVRCIQYLSVYFNMTTWVYFNTRMVFIWSWNYYEY